MRERSSLCRHGRIVGVDESGLSEGGRGSLHVQFSGASPWGEVGWVGGMGVVHGPRKSAARETVSEQWLLAYHTGLERETSGLGSSL